jgi:hypothetical protein
MYFRQNNGTLPTQSKLGSISDNKKGQYQLTRLQREVLGRYVPERSVPIRYDPVRYSLTFLRPHTFHP